MPLRSLLLSVVAVVVPVHSLAAATPANASGLFSGGYLLQVIGSLLLVFGCIFGLLFLLKKLNGVSMGHHTPVRVIGSTRVGTREKVLLLQAGEQQLLIGVSPGGVRTLHVFEKPVVSADQSKNRDFGALLGRVLPTENHR